MVKCLNDFLVTNGFIHHCGLFCTSFRLCPKHLINMPRKALCKQDRKRCHQDNHQTDFPVQHQHEQQRSNQREHPCKQLCKAHQQPICKLVNVCNDTADRFAGWVSVKIRERQLLNLLKGSRPEIPYYLIGNFIVHGLHNPLKQSS